MADEIKTEPAKTGRPSKLTPELIEAIVATVSKGIAPEVAAQAEGISQATYYSWRKQGQEGAEPYATFWNAVTRAIAVSEVSLVEKVAVGDGQATSFGEAKASLELLQRRFPKRWSVQLKVEMAEHLNRFIRAAERVLSNDDFLKLMTELAEEDEPGEAPALPQPDTTH
jgi:hypothetical protein